MGVGRNWKSAAILACGLSVATSAAAEEIRLAPEPGSQWVLEYADDRCRMVRPFGEGERRSLLMLEQFGPSSGVRVTVAGPPMNPLQREKVEFTVGPIVSEKRELAPFNANFTGFGPAIFAYINRLLFSEAEDGQRDRFAVAGLDQLDTGIGAQIDWLRFSRRSDQIVFETGAMESVFSVMNHCTRDLIEFWGLDLERHKTMSRRAELLNRPLVSRKMLSLLGPTGNDEQGTVALTAIIAADGTVRSCSMAEVTTMEKLEWPACEAFEKRARFAPALDARGQPMDSYYSIIFVYSVS